MADWRRARAALRAASACEISFSSAEPGEGAVLDPFGGNAADSESDKLAGLDPIGGTVEKLDGADHHRPTRNQLADGFRRGTAPVGGPCRRV